VEAGYGSLDAARRASPAAETRTESTHNNGLKERDGFFALLRFSHAAAQRRYGIIGKFVAPLRRRVRDLCMRKLFFLAASFLIFCTPSLVSACTCAFTLGTCQQTWKSADLIFTGKVTRKVPVGEGVNIDVSYTMYAFEFQVTEVFRGFAFEGQTVLVHTGAGGGDCGYQFKIGTNYLVYASLNNGRLGTNICTPTRPSAGALHIVRQLRALQKGGRAADLFGTIATSPVAFTDINQDIKPLAGKQVRVIDGNNVEQSTTTDDEGIFSFQDLPAGTYRIEVSPPLGMSTWALNKGEIFDVDIGAPRASGCPVNITFSPDGRIKGKVIDEDGNGVAGFIATEPVDEKEADAAKWHGGTMGYETETGDFELWLLRPSQYRLVFRRKIDGHVNFAVPPFKSEVITIGLGERFEDFRFTVPAVRP
jgi:hypothetical protein